MTSSKRTVIDLNCDMGESYGVYRIGEDEAIMPYVTSVNIACGFHAGDASTMRRTVKLALEHHVAVGAHPGLPDLQGFGRREMKISAQEATDIVLYQIGALQAITKSEGGHLQHVKPHGALYNMAARDKQLADAIASAVYQADPELILIGLAGSQLLVAGAEIGLRTASEAFADRTYLADGSLTPRGRSDATIHEVSQAIYQVNQLATLGSVSTVDGDQLELRADTICIHGDGTHALQFAKAINEGVRQSGVRLQSLGKTFVSE